MRCGARFELDEILELAANVVRAGERSFDSGEQSIAAKLGKGRTPLEADDSDRGAGVHRADSILLHSRFDVG